MHNEENSEPNAQKPQRGDADGGGNRIRPGQAGAPDHQATPPNTGGADQHPKPSVLVRIWYALWRKRLFWWHVRSKHGDPPNWAEKTSMYITGGILLATAVQVGVYVRQANLMEHGLNQNGDAIIVSKGQLGEIAKQYPELQRSAQAAKDAAETAKQSLNSVDRAYVVFDTIRFATIEETASGQKNIFRFNPRWQNSGNTPAVPAIQDFFAKSLDHREPTEEQFVGKEKAYVPFLIGPRTFQDGNFVDTPESEIIESQASVTPKKFFVVWGWMLYRDVLPETDPHLTEFCLQLAGVGEQHKTVNLVNSAPVLGWSGCAHHECVDKYCKDYDQMVKLLPKE